MPEMKKSEAVYLHIKRFDVVLLIILTVLIMLPVSVQASGSREDMLPEALRLIDERKYNDAILILTEMLKTEPQRIDEIQALLARIRTEKDNYNDRYEELIDTYGGDNVEAAYPIIKELEELDPQPNEATRESLVLARETAGFVFNNNRWNDIMERAAASIASGEYDAAVEIYMEGFDLSRDIFLDADYGNIAVNEIAGRAELMDSLCRDFLALYSDFNSGAEAVAEAFSARDAGLFQERILAMREYFNQNSEIRKELKDAADYFLLQEEALRTNRGDDKQIHYLIYLDRLLNGRTNSESREGITGAIDILWDSLYRPLENNSVAYTRELYETALKQYHGDEPGEAVRTFSEAAGMAGTAALVIDNGLLYGIEYSGPAREPILTTSPELLVSDRYFTDDSIRTSESFRLVMSELDALEDAVARMNAVDENAEDLRGLSLDIRLGFSAVRTAVDDELLVIEERIAALGEAAAENYDLSRSYSLNEKALSELERLSADALAGEIRVAAIVSEIELARAEDRFSGLLAEVDESMELLEGVPGEAAEVPASDAAADGETDFVVTYKYPQKAADNALAAEAGIRTLAEDVRDIEADIRSERAEIRSGEAVAAAAEHAAQLLEKCDVQLGRIDGIASRAREQIFTAEKLKQEGERRIEESRTLTRRAQFQAAKGRLEAAAGKFDESLSYMEDSVLRNYRDNEIPRLYKEIQTAENNLVVRQVREYLTEGRAAYSEGNFAAAQSVLIKAQSRWSDTNVEPNAEVEYWLTLTQTALSVTSGRIIAETDPLYAEMNQYLNQAQADFTRAKDEYSAGRRTEADVYFASAEQSILFVQQFFPFNEEARVLNLRISQYRDPERFNEIFRSDFLDARRLISTNPQKAYIDLKDLEAINDSFPGLQAAIVEAEFAAGIKVRPPDPAKLARSTELYQLAYNIVSRNIRSEFNVALSYLDEAISLNSDNVDAIRLKDRISADVGGTATAVMSSADQQLYQEAVSEYTAGNYLKARIIVENLLKDPANQRNTKLIELKERIERTR